MSVQNILAANQPTLLKCHPEDALQTVSTLMSLNHVNALPVLDHENNLIGIVSVWDIITEFANSGADMMALNVANVMTSKVVTCDAATTLTQAIAIMNNNKISNIVVVKDQKVQNTLSVRDVLRALHNKEALEINVLKDIAIAARH